MGLRRDVNLGIGVLLVALALTCFGAIGLFERMSPAIERIIADNDYSLSAAEEMLALLVLVRDAPEPDAVWERFGAALGRARHNVTERDEQHVLDTIEQRMAAATHGDARALTEIVEELRKLTTINRAAMQRADEHAKRLGTAGAWSMVLLGVVGFAAGLFVSRRLRHRVIEPLGEVHSVLSAAAAGDARRRCHVSATSPDVAFVLRSINALLDQRGRQGSSAAASDECAAADREHAMVLHLLDAHAEPLAIVTSSGHVHAANQAALARLQDEAGLHLRKRFVTAVADGAGAGIRPIRGAQCWLCELDRCVPGGEVG